MSTCKPESVAYNAIEDGRNGWRGSKRREVISSFGLWRGKGSFSNPFTCKHRNRLHKVATNRIRSNTLMLAAPKSKLNQMRPFSFDDIKFRMCWTDTHTLTHLIIYANFNSKSIFFLICSMRMVWHIDKFSAYTCTRTTTASTTEKRVLMCTKIFSSCCAEPEKERIWTVKKSSNNKRAETRRDETRNENDENKIYQKKISHC